VLPCRGGARHFRREDTGADGVDADLHPELLAASVNSGTHGWRRPARSLARWTTALVSNTAQ
jgi:hypothetical protein